MKILTWNNHFILHTVLLLLSFVIVTTIGMILNPQSFQKFFLLTVDRITSTPHISYYWDIHSYAELSINFHCSAFYPLWPRLIHWLYSPQTSDEAAQWMLVTATAIFILSLPLVLLTFRTALQDKRTAFGIALLYTLSPMAIFRVIGYTESLFSLLSLALLFLLIAPQRFPRVLLFLIVFLLSALLSLTRPTLIQTIGSCCLTLLSFIGIETIQQRSENYQSWLQLFKNAYLRTFKRNSLLIPISICLILGAVFGYGLYGLFCLKDTGSFFQPFLLQKNWDKSLGFRPWLLLTSRSPLIDLLGLYLPILCCLIAFIQIIVRFWNLALPRLYTNKLSLVFAFYPPLWIILQICVNKFKGFSQGKKNKKMEAPNSEKYLFRWMYCYGFWFALYFATSHSIIVFLTQDRLVSLGRYIFAQPFIFLTLGYIYCNLDQDQQRFLLPSLCGVSILWLINQWIRYGNHQWLG